MRRIINLFESEREVVPAQIIEAPAPPEFRASSVRTDLDISFASNQACRVIPVNPRSSIALPRPRIAATGEYVRVCLGEEQKLIPYSFTFELVG